MPEIDILTGESRKRNWTEEEKLSVLAAAFAPGAVPAEVARRVNISSGQLYTWRKQLMKAPSMEKAFARVVNVSTEAPVAPLLEPPRMTEAKVSARAGTPAIEIALAGSHVRISAGISAELASAVLRVLVRP